MPRLISILVWFLIIGKISPPCFVFYFGSDGQPSNRGMGESDKPLLRYTTSEMAKDIVELLDHVGWKDERSIHVVGISMGGMIAQELVGFPPQYLLTRLTFLRAFKYPNAYAAST